MYTPPPVGVQIITIFDAHILSQYRVQQLDVVMSTLKPHRQALVMGDFNYVPEWKEEGCLDKDFKGWIFTAGDHDQVLNPSKLYFCTL